MYFYTIVVLYCEFLCSDWFPIHPGCSIISIFFLFLTEIYITHNFFAHAQKVARVSPSAQSFLVSASPSFASLIQEFRMAQLLNLFALLDYEECDTEFCWIGSESIGVAVSVVWWLHGKSVDRHCFSKVKRNFVYSHTFAEWDVPRICLPYIEVSKPSNITKISRNPSKMLRPPSQEDWQTY